MRYLCLVCVVLSQSLVSTAGALSLPSIVVKESAAISPLFRAPINHVQPQNKARPFSASAVKQQMRHAVALTIGALVWRGAHVQEARATIAKEPTVMTNVKRTLVPATGIVLVATGAGVVLGRKRNAEEDVEYQQVEAEDEVAGTDIVDERLNRLNKEKREARMILERIEAQRQARKERRDQDHLKITAQQETLKIFQTIRQERESKMNSLEYPLGSYPFAMSLTSRKASGTKSFDDSKRPIIMNGMSHSIAKPQTTFNGASKVSLRAKTDLNEQSPPAVRVEQPATTVPTSPPSLSVETQEDSMLKTNAVIQCDTGSEAGIDSEGTASKDKLSKPLSAKVKMFIISEKYSAPADAPPDVRSSFVEPGSPVIDKGLDPSARDTDDVKESTKGESQSQVGDLESHLKNKYSVVSLDAKASETKVEARAVKVSSKGGGSSMETQSKTVKPLETLDVKCRDGRAGVIKKEPLSKKPDPPAVMLHEVKSPSENSKTLVRNKFLPLKIKSSANDKSVKPDPPVNALADIKKPSAKPETAVKNKFLPLVKTKSSIYPTMLKQDPKPEAGYNVTDASSKVKNATHEHGACMLRKADCPTANRENDKPGTPTGDSSDQAKHASLYSRLDTSPKESTLVTVSAKPVEHFSKKSPSLNSKKASTAKAQTPEAKPKAALDEKTPTLNKLSAMETEKETVNKKKDVLSESRPGSAKNPAAESKPVGSNAKSAPSRNKVKEKARNMQALQVDSVPGVNSTLVKSKVAVSDDRSKSAEIENAKKDPPTGASAFKTENSAEKPVAVTNGKPTTLDANSSATEVKADVAPKKQDASVGSRSESKHRAVIAAKTIAVADKHQQSPKTTKKSASEKQDPAADELTKSTLAKAKTAAGRKFLELYEKSLSPVEKKAVFEKQDPSKSKHKTTKRSTNPWVSSTVNANGGLSEMPKHKARAKNTQSDTATGTNLDVRARIELVKGKSRNIQVTEVAPLEEVTPESESKSKPEPLKYFLDVVEPTKSEASFTAVGMTSTASPEFQLEEATVAALTKKPWWKKYASSNDSLEEAAIAVLDDFAMWSFIETPKLLVSAALWAKDLFSGREGEPPEGK